MSSAPMPAPPFGPSHAPVVVEPCVVVESEPVDGTAVAGAVVADGEAVGSAAATRLGMRNDAPAAPNTSAPVAIAVETLFICLLLLQFLMDYLAIRSDREHILQKQ